VDGGYEPQSCTLQLACRLEDMETIKSLILAVDENKYLEIDGITNVGLIQLLENSGFVLSIKSSSLKRIIRRGNLELLKVCLPFADRAEKCFLDSAIKSGNIEAVKILLDHKVSFTNEHLNLACLYGDLNIVEFLVENSEFQISIGGELFATRRTKCILAILKSTTDVDFVSAVRMAYKHKLEEVVELIFKNLKFSANDVVTCITFFELDRDFDSIRNLVRRPEVSPMTLICVPNPAIRSETRKVFLEEGVKFEEFSGKCKYMIKTRKGGPPTPCGRKVLPENFRLGYCNACLRKPNIVKKLRKEF
jgi:hypothetical protein